MHCSFSAAVGFGFGFFSSAGCLRGPSLSVLLVVMMSSRVVSDRSTTSSDSFYANESKEEEMNLEKKRSVKKYTKNKSEKKQT